MSFSKQMASYVILISSLCVTLQASAAAMHTPAPASGHNPFERQAIFPSDVLARVKLLQQELEFVRIAMGKPKREQHILSIKNAAPREVLFSAQSLFKKANRLSYEVTKTLGEEVEATAGQIKPYDVWHTVNAALKRILLVKEKLAITHQAKEVVQAKHTTPTQVMNAIVDTNYILNSILSQPFTPSQVYQSITLGIHYTALLLKNFPVNTYIPDATDFVANKKPVDVYIRLSKCMDLLKEISKSSKVNMLEYNINQEAYHQITPGAVFDLSRIINAEVVHLHKLAPNSKEKVISSYYPGFKIPAEVFQRAGILLSQLEMLKEQVNQQPNWLALKP